MSWEERPYSPEWLRAPPELGERHLAGFIHEQIIKAALHFRAAQADAVRPTNCGSPSQSSLAESATQTAGAQTASLSPQFRVPYFVAPGPAAVGGDLFCAST